MTNGKKTLKPAMLIGATVSSVKCEHAVRLQKELELSSMVITALDGSRYRVSAEGDDSGVVLWVERIA